MVFSLKNLVKQGEKIGGSFFWQNMYASKKNISAITTASAKKMMDENPELASHFLGKTLLHIECQDSKHPERKEQELEESIKQTAIDLGYFNEKEYEIIADVGLGICLPGNKKYKVRIKIGEFELTTSDPKESKDGYNRWSERFNTQTMKTSYPSIDEMDKVLIYLMDGDSEICYYKGSVHEWTDPNPAKYKWLIMKRDPVIAAFENDWDAGVLQIKMSINDKAKNGPVEYKQFDAWKRPPPRRLMSKKIRCFIF